MCEEKRQCRICGEFKRIEDMEKDSRYKNGHYSTRCKACKYMSQSKAARALQHMREKAAKEGREVEVTLKELQTLFSVFESCAYCGKNQSESDDVFHVEHIIPRSAGGSDTISNLCIICPTCNLTKHTKPFAVYFFENRGRITDDRFSLIAHYIALTSEQPIENVVYDMADHFARYELRKKLAGKANG